ncbi:MAG: hypothetical protein AB7U73_23870 [Pirellulales bacterium]|uniref:hypothetical protein n=1 Tax=Bradyrhizobium sp. TaxID=376 RepID=UPI003D0CEAD4
MSHSLDIAIAQPQHGQDIRRLIRCEQVEGLEELDWENLGGQWIVILKAGAVVGCIQVLPGKPIARAEFMVLDDSLSNRERAEATSMLIQHVTMLLRMAGCGAMISVVADDVAGWPVVLERRGWVPMIDGTMMIRRL